MLSNSCSFLFLRRSVLKPEGVCRDSKEGLGRFVEAMRKRGVALYFANPPFVAGSEHPIEGVRRADAMLAAELAPYGRMIDSREEQSYPQECFFDSDLHRNPDGWRIRTRHLVEDLKRSVPTLAGVQGKPGGGGAWR